MLRKLGNVALEVAPSLTVQGYFFGFKAPLDAKRKIAPILIFALNANRKVTANHNVDITLTQITGFESNYKKHVCLVPPCQAARIT